MSIHYVIRTEQPKDMRYATAGDWYDVAGTTQIVVANLGDPKKEALVAVHELIEKIICDHQGITEEQVDDWDLSHGESDEPGLVKGCPYMEAHIFAGAVEAMLARKIGVDWGEHEAACSLAVAEYEEIT